MKSHLFKTVSSSARVVAVITAGFILVSCTSNKHEVKEIDTKLNEKGRLGQEKIGVNKDGEAVIQDDIDAASELRSQEWVNTRLSDELARDHHELRRCREDLSDPRLGGSGEVKPLPQVDNLKPPAKLREEFGLNEEGQLKVVKREYYLDRLEKERKYEQALRETKKLVGEAVHECEVTMGQARVKHGLPAKRYESKGYYDDRGNWVESRRAETTLDEAFDILAREKTKN